MIACGVGEATVLVAWGILTKSREEKKERDRERAELFVGAARAPSFAARRGGVAAA